MKNPLYFHIRPEIFEASININGEKIESTLIEDDVKSHTYCINRKDEDPNKLFIGYSVTHKNDQFNKKKGRRIAKQRMEIALRIPNEKLNNKNVRLHDSVKTSFTKVIERTKTIMKITGNIKCIVRGDINGKKVFTELSI